MKKILCGMWEKIAVFCVKKNVIVSAKRYGIDAMGAMAQGLFASLLIGTIISTLGQQLDMPVLVEIGNYAKAVAGPAMAVSIGYALQAPQLVLFSLLAVGSAANTLGGSGGPLAVLVIAILAAECGKIVSKETKVDILVTPFVTICVGVLLAMWWAPGIGAAAPAAGVKKLPPGAFGRGGRASVFPFGNGLEGNGNDHRPGAEEHWRKIKNVRRGRTHTEAVCALQKTQK